MIKHVWTVICSNAVVDMDTNNVSLHNVIEQLNIPESPKPKGFLPIHLELVTLWFKDDTDAAVKAESRVSFVSSSGETRVVATPPIDLSEKSRARNRLIFDALPLDATGVYHFTIEMRSNGDWIEVASIPLTVIFSPSETDEAQEAMEVNNQESEEAEVQPKPFRSIEDA